MKRLRLFLVFFLCFVSINLLHSSHIILDKNDLKLGALFPKDPSKRDRIGFALYWKCHSVIDFRINCIPTGEDAFPNDPALLVRLTLIVGKKRTIFEPRRAWGWWHCKTTVERWRFLLKNQKEFCTLASTRDEEYWEIDALKSKRGLWTYFTKPGI